MKTSNKLYLVSMTIGMMSGVMSFLVWSDRAYDLMFPSFVTAVSSAVVGMVASVFALFGKEVSNG